MTFSPPIIPEISPELVATSLQEVRSFGLPEWEEAQVWTKANMPLLHDTAITLEAPRQAGVWAGGLAMRKHIDTGVIDLGTCNTNHRTWEREGDVWIGRRDVFGRANWAFSLGHAVTDILETMNTQSGRTAFGVTLFSSFRSHSEILTAAELYRDLRIMDRPD